MRKVLLLIGIFSLIASQAPTEEPPLILVNFPKNSGLFLVEKYGNYLINGQQLMPDRRVEIQIAHSSFLHDVILKTGFQAVKDTCYWALWDFFGEYIFSGKKITPELEEYLKKEILKSQLKTEKLELRTIRPCSKWVLNKIRTIYSLLTGIKNPARVFSYGKTIFIDQELFIDQKKSQDQIEKEIAAAVVAEAYALTKIHTLLAKILALEITYTFIKNLALWSFTQKNPIKTVSYDEGTLAIISSMKMTNLNLVRLAKFLARQSLYRKETYERDDFMACTSHGGTIRDILAELDEEEYRFLKYIPAFICRAPHYEDRIEYVDSRINEWEKVNQLYKQR
jgi:hypothetical protein